jgi:hypothetical protein
VTSEYASLSITRAWCADCVPGLHMKRAIVVGLGVIASMVACAPPAGDEEDIDVDQSGEALTAIAPRAVTASNTYPGSSPALAGDGISTTKWSSGGYAPQWIRFDLGRPYDLGGIKLLTEQKPAGPTTHLVYGWYDGATYTLLGGFDRDTATGQWLTLPTRARGIRYVKVTTTKSPSWVGWREIQVSGTASSTQTPIDPACPGLYAGHDVRRFGYFASAFIYGDHTPAIAPHSNVTWASKSGWISASTEPTNPAGDIARLESAKANDTKAILSIPGVFLDKNLRLRPDYAANWRQYSAAIAPYVQHVAAFYPLDEPYMVGEKYGITLAEMQKALETINASIESTFPGVPIAVIFNGAEITSTLVIPKGYDWIGFDCYGSFDDCKGHPIPWYVSTLKSRMTAGQRLFLVPDGSIPTPKDTLPSLQQQLDLVTRIDRYYDLARRDSRVIGMFPFLWQRLVGPAGQWDWAGTSEMPIVKEKYQSIGRCITEKL